MTDSNKDQRDPLLAELTTLLTDRAEEAIAARVNLRDAVCEYVSVERARGMPLAAVIQTVKDILRAAEKGAGTATDALARQLIDWCIEFHRSTAPVKPVLLS